MNENYNLPLLDIYFLGDYLIKDVLLVSALILELDLEENNDGHVRIAYAKGQ
jgi:hypothetical protein